MVEESRPRRKTEMCSNDANDPNSVCQGLETWGACAEIQRPVVAD